MSSGVKPLALATSSGRRWPLRPSIVALATLRCVGAPSDFDNASRTPGRLEYLAYRPAGNHAGAGRCRLEKHARRTVSAYHLMYEGGAGHRDGEH